MFMLRPHSALRVAVWLGVRSCGTRRLASPRWTPPKDGFNADRACQVLAEECAKREIHPSRKVKFKPWRLALLIHRHDMGERQSNSSEDFCEFRTGIRPKQDQILEWIHANNNNNNKDNHPPPPKPFSKRNQKLAAQQIVEERQRDFVRELMRALHARRIPIVRRFVDGAKNSGEALGYLACLLAQTLAAGGGQLVPKRKVPRVRAPWAKEMEQKRLAKQKKPSKQKRTKNKNTRKHDNYDLARSTRQSPNTDINRKRRGVIRTKRTRDNLAIASES